MRTTGRSVREGWGWLALVSAAQGFLALVAALAAIALLPALFGWSSSVVQSSSMEPGVSAGDVVLTSVLADDEPVPVGAAVTFERDGQLILHRLVKSNDDGTFATAGDANEQLDSDPVERAEITGVARLLVPALGLPSFWIDSKQFAPLALWLVTIAFAVGIVAVGFPRTEVHEQSAEARHADTRPSAGAARTTSITILALALIVSPVVAPHGAAQAAFSARTDSVHNVWRAKVFTPMSMGRASSFAVLAAVGISNSSSFNTGITGSVGTSPGRSITGFWPWDVSGDTALDTASARAAMADASAVPAAASERGTTKRLAPALAGTLLPGVYESTSGAFTVSGSLVLDAKGDSSARFIFRTSGALTLAQRAQITLAGGARAENVWWVVGSTMTAGNSSLSRDASAVGNFLVTGQVQLRGIRISGRVVSRTASVAMAATQIVVPTS